MADFTFTPDFPIEEKIRHNTLISESENGVEERRKKWSAPVREFALTFTNRTQAEYEAFMAFLISKDGPAVAFTFESPNDGEVYNVRFKEDEVPYSRTGPSIYAWECSLVEVK